ncbi:co-chaperone protein DjlA [Alishewanella longhuensis]|uniref:Co-chaperone protein DjlA n=1 Tax=Alishewanella longhuensis TaxID=1091037 RepID=A0ABQ3KW34_9ALTE|nr:co-chaperone DjlA [Alishewanella longhuensis]GHG61246.1 co-chaperone protein DjlA [Alishewanella longhuensis]
MWGKILGALFGLALFKLPGLILGVLVGHYFDQWFQRKLGNWEGIQSVFGQDDEQALFMYSSFAAMGHIAKATGVVTKAHINQASHFMQQLGLNAQQKKEAQAAFRDGKAVNFPFKVQINEFYQRYKKRPDVLQLFLEIQLSIACVEGRVEQEQYKLLLQVADCLQISKNTLDQLLLSYQAQSRFQQNPGTAQEQAKSLLAAYQVLGCVPEVTEQELKRAYRKLMAQHHPDKLMAQGVPAAMLDVAKRRTQDIQAAYELIKQQRAKSR